MWSFVNDAPAAVQMVMLLLCVLMGVSHLIQRRMWSQFFGMLGERGTSGLIANSFISTTTAAVIVGLHQVWNGPAVLLTLFGWMLLLKSVIGLWLPALGMRSLRLSRHGDWAFRGAGIGLLVIAAACALALGKVWK